MVLDPVWPRKTVKEVILGTVDGVRPESFSAVFSRRCKVFDDTSNGRIRRAYATVRGLPALARAYHGKAYLEESGDAPRDRVDDIHDAYGGRAYHQTKEHLVRIC